MSNVEPSKFYFRQRQRNRLYEDVVEAIERAAMQKGVRQKDIAQRLNVSPTQVSRWLSGPANWGIDTVSDLMFAIDAELDFTVQSFEDRARRNEFHPAGQISQTPSTRVVSASGPGAGTVVIPPMPPHVERNPNTLAQQPNG